MSPSGDSPFVVDGTFSTAGRNTAAGLDKLKTLVKETAPKLRRASTATGLREGSGSSPSGDGDGEGRREGLASFARRVRAQGFPQLQEGLSSTPASPKDASPAEPRKGRFILDEEPDSPSSPLRRSSSIAFTAQGMDSPRFCDTTCAVQKRFIAPDPSKKDVPGAGHYNPAYRLQHRRMTDTELGIREKHLSRSDPPPAPPDDSRYQDMNSSRFSFASTAASKGDREQQGLMSPRRALNKSLGRTFRDELLLHEMSPHSKEWAKHDEYSSVRDRYPTWDLQKHASGHKLDFQSNFFEPGKYNVDSGPNSPSAKAVVPFARRLSRSESEGNHGRAGQIAMLAPYSPKSGILLDRSLYRGARGRMLHVSDFAKDLDRPPLMSSMPEYHDADDPEADAAVMHHAMTFDATTADTFVIARRDHAPVMSSSIGRGAVRGSRLAESDVTNLMAKGVLGQVPETLTNTSVEKLSEAPSGRRRDVGRKFMGHTFREPTRMHASAGRIRRPRSSAAPDFARTARSGFSPKTSVPRPFVINRERSYEALEGEA